MWTLVKFSSFLIQASCILLKQHVLGLYSAGKSTSLSLRNFSMTNISQILLLLHIFAANIKSWFKMESSTGFIQALRVRHHQFIHFKRKTPIFLQFIQSDVHESLRTTKPTLPSSIKDCCIYGLIYNYQVPCYRGCSNPLPCFNQ